MPRWRSSLDLRPQAAWLHPIARPLGGVAIASPEGVSDSCALWQIDVGPAFLRTVPIDPREPLRGARLVRWRSEKGERKEGRTSFRFTPQQKDQKALCPPFPSPLCPPFPSPLTSRITRLFNPRRDRWKRHFRYEGPCLVGRTAVGRTTIVVLAMNHPDAVTVRRSLIEEGLFPTKQ
jgi:hypothetical protein